MHYTQVMVHGSYKVNNNNVQFQKISIPPTEGQWKFQGGGGLKGGNFQGVGGCPNEEFLQRVRKFTKNRNQGPKLPFDIAEKFIVIIQKKSSATDESF